ncbi:hypothetical protein glysoja_009486 [Glycine soja]|nr:hypothetical protein glysoja_009486 [Glycine soja]
MAECKPCLLEKEYDANAQPNSEMADATKKCGESYVLLRLLLDCSVTHSAPLSTIYWESTGPGGRFCFTLFSVSLSGLPSSRQPSTSLRLENHLAILVFMATSIYSFFFDKAANGKPDAYSLISYASFVAIMSLGLSRLTQFGFEIDLLHFFCGGLIIQLLEIKRWLVIIGGCFIYFLVVILRPSLKTPEQRKMGMLWTVFLFWVWTYVTQSNSSSQEDSGNDGLIPLRFINCIMSLEKENEMLVPMVCSHVNKYLKAVVDSESKDKGHIPELQLDPDVNFMMDAQPSGISMHLHETVKLMMAAGFEQECCDAYSNCHKEFLEQCLWALGLQLQALNTWNIENWIKTCKAAGKILFPNERRLCDSVFFGLSRNDNWFRQTVTKVGHNCKLYQRSSWNKMLHILMLEGKESVVPPNVVAESMKDKLNLFNLMFVEICAAQSTWIVSDKQLREQIIKSIDSILLPVYGKFTDRFRDVFGKHAYEYIEFGIVDIQNFLSNLFLLSEQRNPIQEAKERASMFAWI